MKNILLNIDNVFITSDTHFDHNKDFIYKKRGFTCVDDMNKTLVENWNSVVKPNSIVYHLGDVMMGNNYEKIIPLLCSLNGHKILIRGNHDTEHRIHLFMENKIFEKWIWADCFKIGKKIFYLSHYYTETSNHEDKNPPINLYGHIHSNFIYTSDRPCGFHVGVDATKLSPISIKDILNIEKGNI